VRWDVGEVPLRVLFRRPPPEPGVTVSDHRVAKIVCARGSQRSCGFKSGAAASFSGTGITVNSTTYNSATSLTVNITIAASSSTGIRNITVSNTDAGISSCAALRQHLRILNGRDRNRRLGYDPNQRRLHPGPGNALSGIRVTQINLG
jgi:hypothetical protein